MKAVLLVVPPIPYEPTVSNSIRSDNIETNKERKTLAPACKPMIDNPE